jgi:hypothetical protein
MEGDSIKFSLIKLTDNNWPDFKMYLQGYAIQIKAEDILCGTEKSPVVQDPPTEQSTIRLMSFRDRNSKLYLAILTSVTEKHRIRYNNTKQYNTIQLRYDIISYSLLSCSDSLLHRYLCYSILIDTCQY